MQVFLIDTLFGFLLSPWVTHRAMATMVRNSDPQSPTFWKAISAGVIATLSVMFGLVFGAGAGGALATVFGYGEPPAFFASLIGGLLALVVNFWRILLVYNRQRGSLPD